MRGDISGDALHVDIKQTLIRHLKLTKSAWKKLGKMGKFCFIIAIKYQLGLIVGRMIMILARHS
jgi:hypothetical protein